MVIATVAEKPVTFGQFKFNNSLMYAIKSVSGDSENEIVAYFYEMAIQLFNDCINRKTLPQRCNRTVKVFYKNTDFQVKFEVWTNYFKSSYNNTIHINMALGYPGDYTTIDGQKIDSTLFETSIGLTDEQVTVVKKPKEKTYRCLNNNNSTIATSTLNNEMMSFLPEALKKKYCVSSKG